MVSSLPPGAADSDVFWETSRALMEVGPVVLGMRPARVQMKRDLRKAEYQVEFPPSRGLLARARRFVDVAVSGNLFMKELERQNENLMESYEALQCSERSFRRLVEESPEGMVVYDGESIVFANDALAKLVGLERGSACPFSNTIEGLVYMKKRFVQKSVFLKITSEAVVYSLLFGGFGAWLLF